MAEKPKCSQCHERDVFSKNLCSGCYGKNWRAARRAERDRLIAEQFPPKQLTSGATNDETAVIECEIVKDGPPDPHLTALNPIQMEAARGDMKAWLDQRLTIIERDIVSTNAALEEARQNGWNTSALVAARNRAIDDETFYNKVLMAVEAGHTIIPDFPISVFAVRTASKDKGEQHTWTSRVDKKELWLSNPVQPDAAPAGAGEFRNPEPQVQEWYGSTRKDSEGKEYRPYIVRRTGLPKSSIVFPNYMARPELIRATADAMREKCFDQVGVCLPVAPDARGRRIQETRGQAGDPLVIGQVVHRNRRRVASFIIAWYVNMNDL